MSDPSGSEASGRGRGQRASPWSGRSARAASGPEGVPRSAVLPGTPSECPLEGEGVCLAASPGTGEEEAERCGLPWLRNSARSHSNAHSLQSSQRSQPKMVSLGPDASQAHLPCCPGLLTWAGVSPGPATGPWRVGGPCSAERAGETPQAEGSPSLPPGPTSVTSAGRSPGPGPEGVVHAVSPWLGVPHRLTRARLEPLVHSGPVRA